MQRTSIFLTRLFANEPMTSDLYSTNHASIHPLNETLNWRYAILRLKNQLSGCLLGPASASLVVAYIAGFIMSCTKLKVQTPHSTQAMAFTTCNPSSDESSGP